MQESAPVERSAKHRGAYPTPAWLVDDLVRQTVPPVIPGQRITVLDPACGDGRFLLAAAELLLARGAVPTLRGVDVDPDAVALARRRLDGLAIAPELIVADALADDVSVLGAGSADVVVGNPPFLSQLATATSRGGASGHGGGPYADAAAEFLALSVGAARRDGGRVGLVLPQSVLASRDAAPIRAEVDRLAAMRWSWWSPRPVFEAQVLVCALVFERVTPPRRASTLPWTSVVTDALGVPAVPRLRTDGRLADHAYLTANFRDQYYGVVPAVVDEGRGPPLITSGLIDPGRCRWGQRPVTYARRRHQRPRVELERLPSAMQRWANALLVPKVLVANQTRVIEAVVDAAGEWVPGVPVITARRRADGGRDARELWDVAAVLTSPVASAWAWHHAAGTGLSARSLRLGPRWLADLPWPHGSLAAAVEALRAGEVVETGRAVSTAYGLDRSTLDAADLHAWWQRNLPA
jgi:SAM-dependent methyltransferase